MKKTDAISSTSDVEIEYKLPKKSITPLELDFGRDDLNQLRDKLNEVIRSRHD